MDELSMLVKRVQPDGRVRLTPLGTMYPANFGLGPVLMLGDREHVCGVLTVGSEHTTQESPQIWQTKPDGGDRALNWSDVYVFTGRTPDQLAEAGIRPGTRVCVHRSKRELVEIDDYLGSYFMDDRALLVVLLSAARELRQRPERPPQDVYFVCTVSEEVGGLGGSYASRALPGELTLALEVGPTEAEYGTTVTGGPIVGYSDAQCVYDKGVADRLVDVATELGTDPQPAVLGAFESDASHAKSNGHTAAAGLLCLPTLSTHGYEVVPRDGIGAMSDVLVEFLMQPVPFAEGTSRVNRAAPRKDAS
jgi:putative aminopeptidase FrvX